MYTVMYTFPAHGVIKMKNKLIKAPSTGPIELSPYDPIGDM